MLRHCHLTPSFWAILWSWGISTFRRFFPEVIFVKKFMVLVQKVTLISSHIICPGQTPFNFLTIFCTHYMQLNLMKLFYFVWFWELFGQILRSSWQKIRYDVFLAFALAVLGTVSGLRSICIIPKKYWALCMLEYRSLKSWHIHLDFGGYHILKPYTVFLLI